MNEMVKQTWGKVLVPGDCLVLLNRSAKGIILVIGVVDEGAYVMHTQPSGTKFGFEKWSSIHSSWANGQTRKLSTFL